MLVPILFWLSVPASLVSSIFGVVKNKYWLVLVGAILLFPISYYMNGSPSIHGFGLLLPFFQIGSAAAVREENKLWAWLLLIPMFLMIAYFIFFVMYVAFVS